MILERFQLKQYRNEWKYLINEIQAQQMKERICSVMEKDSFANEAGQYVVRSIYFDDYYDTCARKNVSGDGIRYKYRIRYYNDSLQRISLEKKEKKNSYCHKRSALLSVEETQMLITGKPEELLWSTSGELVREFATDILTKAFAPKVIISYTREAFVEPITNVRITFDSKITASDEFDMFLSPEQYLSIPFISDNQRVLEVKFDEVLPSYVKKVIQNTTINQQAFSKYYMGRIAIQNFYQKGAII